MTKLYNRSMNFFEKINYGWRKMYLEGFDGD